MLKWLKVVDTTLASYLKIASSEQSKFTYYTFSTGQAEHWDLLGIHTVREHPLLIEVRLMSIEQEDRDWEPFVAERDAPGYITVNPITYLDIITFFEMVLDDTQRDLDKTLEQFSLLSQEELRRLNPSLVMMESSMSTSYLSTPTRGLQAPDRINIISFPSWSPRYGMHQSNALWFTSVSQQQAHHPDFDFIDDTNGLGLLPFDQGALEEFVLLLKKHRMQNM